MAARAADFSCKLTIDIPFPSARLAETALRAISVDEELSPLVRRSLCLAAEGRGVLRTRYQATTDRMLRVAVNGFFESVGVVLAAMRELDVDVAAREWVGGGEGPEAEVEAERDIRMLGRVQGLSEQGRIG